MNRTRFPLARPGTSWTLKWMVIVPGPYTRATAWCSSARTTRCLGFVNPSVVETVKSSAILVNPAGLKPTVRSWRRAYSDHSFELEKRKNEPAKVQWELWNEMIDAMKNVEEIKQRRQATFIMNRSKKKKELQRAQDIKEAKPNSSGPMHAKGGGCFQNAQRWWGVWTRTLFLTLSLSNHFYESSGNLL